MNYLESLSDNEKLVITRIVDYWNNCSARNIDVSKPHDEVYGIPLHDLVFKFINERTLLQIEDISYKIEIDSGQIDFYQFFKTEKANNKLGEQHKFEVELISIDNSRWFLIVVNFLKRLYDDGLIYFEYEEFSLTTYNDWDSRVKDFPAPEYIHHSECFFSKDIAKFLDLFLGSPIIPSFQLIELYKYDFKTVEKRRYESQQSLSNKALRSAKRGNYIAIGIAIVSTLVAILCSLLIPVSIDKEQHKAIIQTIEKIYYE